MKLNRSVMFAVALMSGAGLMLELAMTRVLSVLYLQSYVFLVLAIAVLGLGLGASLSIGFPVLRQRKQVTNYLLLAALTTLVLTGLMVWTMGESRLLIFGLALLPYLFLGLALVTLFSAYVSASTLLYWMDLVGAGTAVLVTLWLLNVLGPLGTLLITALLLSIAGLCLSPTAPKAQILTSLCTLLLVLQSAWGIVDLSMERLVTPKGILRQLETGGKIVKSRWDAFSRTDLLYSVQRDHYFLFMDGGAGSIVPSLSADSWKADIGRLAFASPVEGPVFLIGPGGGLDVALAQDAGLSDIHVAEVNAASIALVKELRSYAGAVYDLPVKVTVDEGRSVLKRSQEHYAVILLAQVITQAADARAFVMAENYLYTVEAVHDYLDQLLPGGRVVFKLYDELTLTRAFFTAIEALVERGLSEPKASEHLFVALDTKANPPIPLLIVQETPFTREEAIELARLAEQQAFALVFVPGLLVQPPLDALAAGEQALAELVAGIGGFDVRPVRDARPFFYKFEPGLPSVIINLGNVLVGILVLMVLAYLIYSRVQSSSVLRGLPVSFACLGFGFMMIEINVIQRLQLVLGHPSWTLAVVLGSLLLVGGMGSYLAGNLFAHRPNQGVRCSTALIILTWLIWNFGYTLLWSVLTNQTFLFRAVAVVLSLLPLALVLGMPFPLLLRLAGSYHSQQVALAWSINAVTSVMGSVLAVALAMQFGFQVVAVVAALFYFGCLLISLGGRDFSRV